MGSLVRWGKDPDSSQLPQAAPGRFRLAPNAPACLAIIARAGEEAARGMVDAGREYSVPGSGVGSKPEAQQEIFQRVSWRPFGRNGVRGLA
jgi:hypothetical protein